MTKTLRQRWLVSEDESETFYVDFTPSLSSGETIATVDSIEEETTADLDTLEGEPNEAAYTDPHRYTAAGDNVTVAIGKAILFVVSGQLAVTGRYSLKFTVTTSDARILTRRLIFDVA